MIKLTKRIYWSMNMSTQLKEKINISVDNIETLTDVDLADLCNITEQAIKAGGGFGWLRVPTRDILIDYWTKRSNDKYIKLIVGRLNDVIAGTLQLAYEAPNIESRKNIAFISTFEIIRVNEVIVIFS